MLVPKYLEEAGSMGAAVIAGVGSGIYKDFSAIDQFIQVQKKVEPDEAARKIYAPLREKFEEVYQALKPVKPSYNSKQALVKTISCGICNGTDEKLIHRTFKGVGSEVKGYHIGDKVLLPFVDPDPEKYGELDSAWILRGAATVNMQL